jgi:hypothetical protein
MSSAQSVEMGRGAISEDEVHDDDDDIQIFAGEVSDIEGGPRKKRALSLGLMDASMPLIDLELGRNRRCSSPGATYDSASSPSLYPSDDEGIPHLHNPRNLPLPEPDVSPTLFTTFTPALSQTCSISTNSSLVSLPLPPPLRTVDDSSHPNTSLPMEVSRTEKAIAALSLAMANGAGGLDDYEALRTIQIAPAHDEVGQVGEIWH